MIFSPQYGQILESTGIERPHFLQFPPFCFIRGINSLFLNIFEFESAIIASTIAIIHAINIKAMMATNKMVELL